MRAVKSGLLKLLPRFCHQALRRWRAPRLAARFSEADWAEAPVVRALVERGDTVLDIGANIGYIAARLAAYVGPAGRVYAWEPVPLTYDLLTRVVKELKLHQVQPVPMGLSECNAQVTMQIPRTAAGGAENLYESQVVSGADASARSTFSVPVQRLDDWEEGAGRRISFIKLDVEGHEGAAVRGMMQRLATDRPALLIELSGDPDACDDEAGVLTRALDGLGYSMWLWRDQALHRRQPGDRSVDYFFLTQAHLDQLHRDGIALAGH